MAIFEDRISSSRRPSEGTVSDFGEATELVNELVLEADQTDRKEQEHLRWHRQVALTTLLMALVTAVGALLAGITAHEALMDRTREIIDISITENDRVNVEILKAKVEIVTALGESPDPADLALIQAYKAESEAMAAEAAIEETRIQKIAAPHLVLAVAVTLLSVGIALSGMSIIIDQKNLWFAGLVLGIMGSIGVGYGIFILIY